MAVIRVRLPDGSVKEIRAIRGAPGVSPTVEIAKMPGGTAVNITDAQGNHTFMIPNPTVPEAIAAHIEKTDNPHGVTAAQVGLGNVDNTSDADKPVSTAQQAALDEKANSADMQTALAGKANSTDVQTALNGKSNYNHNHTNQELICNSVTCQNIYLSGTMTTDIIRLKANVNYGTNFPGAAAVEVGKLFFKVVTG